MLYLCPCMVWGNNPPVVDGRNWQPKSHRVDSRQMDGELACTHARSIDIDVMEIERHTQKCVWKLCANTNATNSREELRKEERNWRVPSWAAGRCHRTDPGSRGGVRTGVERDETLLDVR
jgi:hypothetical protein